MAIEPTGNVWIEPKTGKPSNPQNVIVGENAGVTPEEKYGPGVLNPAPPVVVDDPTPPTNPDAEALASRAPDPLAGDADDRVFGPGLQPSDNPTATGAAHQEMQAVIDRLIELRAHQRDGTPKERHEAEQELKKIAFAEYSRAEPRAKVTRRLSAYGIGKPEGV